MRQLNEGCISSITADILICMHAFVSLVFKCIYLDSSVSGSVHIVVMYVVSLFIFSSLKENKKKIRNSPTWYDDLFLDKP